MMRYPYHSFFGILRYIIFIIACVTVIECDDSGDMMVGIHVPKVIFDEKKNWKNSIHFDVNLVSLSSNNKTYLDIAETSQASDKNDIYAYEHWFYGIRSGVIIESGGFDGMQFSVSYLFEKFAGWTSILVEADPKNFANMLKNRKDAISIHCALCNSTTTLHYTEGGTVAGILEFMSPAFLGIWHADLDRGDNKDKLRAELKTIQCIRMSSLLNTIGVSRVDLWVLDVEGAEEAVLRSVDWDAVQISTIMMECDGNDQERNVRNMAYLREKKFTCIKPKNDCLCTHESFTPSSRGAGKKRSQEREWERQKTGPDEFNRLMGNRHGRGHLRIGKDAIREGVN